MNLNETQIVFITKVDKPHKQRLWVVLKLSSNILLKSNRNKPQDAGQNVSSNSYHYQKSRQFNGITYNRYGSMKRYKENKINYDHCNLNKNTESGNVLPRLIVDYETTNSGNRWTEREFRDVWYAHHCENKSYLSVAKLQKRTETAILVKCDLLKRAIFENPELDTPSIYQPYQFKGRYLEIINHQSQIEKEMRSQTDRMELDSPLSSLTNYYSKNARKYDLVL